MYDLTRKCQKVKKTLREAYFKALDEGISS